MKRLVTPKRGVKMKDREKIIEIIQPYLGVGADESLANALIEAGIGDVSEWKYRTERADRALINTCAMLYAQGVEYPYSDEEWQLQQAEKELIKEELK